MKTFFQKHKILIISIAIVLCFGIFSGLVIGGAVRLSMQSRPIATVAETTQESGGADAVKQAVSAIAATGQLNPEPTALPASNEPKTLTQGSNEPKTLTMSSDEIARITHDTQYRRQRNVIPMRSRLAPDENLFLWESETADTKTAAAAREAADQLTQTIFGVSFAELTECPIGDASIVLFYDMYGDRDTILRVMDQNGTYLLILRAEDLKLICADLLTYPDSEGADHKKEMLDLAERLGYAAKPYCTENGTDHEICYLYKTDSEECLEISYIGDKLWRVAVYPSEQAMFEGVYFLADIQFDYSTPAYPEKFVKANPPKGRGVMNKEKLFAALTRLYRNLSGEELDTRNIKATFYKDESGAREDCWKLEGGGFAVTVSAYSHNVISFTGTIPCKELLDVPYEQMGGEEYKTAAEMIGRFWITSLGTFGGDDYQKSVKEISANAIADGHVCTMDIELTDGTWYECYFYDGVLKEMWYFANEKMFWVGNLTGWVANTVYVNAATGKKLIPEYRDWDGNLHVKQPGRE